MSGRRRVPDYYSLLGVPRTADAAAIRRGYREQALLHHPDKNPDRVEEATERFKLIAEAYSVLQDPTQRAAYDSGAMVQQTSSNADDEEGDTGFSVGRARDLFRDVFGEEFTAKLARVAEDIAPHLGKVVEGAAPHLKAAAAATTSGLSRAAEHCGRTRVVRGAVSSHLSCLTDEAISIAAEKVREEVIFRKAYEEQLELLKDHDNYVTTVQHSRRDRRVSWWQSVKEWATGDQQAADYIWDRDAAAMSIKIQRRVRQAELAWRQSCRELDDAEAQASRVQQEEEEVHRNGASLGQAAKAGAYHAAYLLGRLV
mmetsp:Transcript_87176/g.244607  ORF Transcript_87176/g.244607 Transcript_87176/m.244607 type:complete len:313 (+) Transcript_87176:59-997(+)|eukprot:CAMPEP_0117473472 /NCGR_PEP_ID=MMETSP0784-20121206/8789_1 /TAXON_ID=39447 /ORGANISM="" /LENGTH=312 /DNA_ID=CAMNT_0005267673 /DNA_START=53 /DNA_END=991 /DNA_ORIENTATION=+